MATQHQPSPAAKFIFALAAAVAAVTIFSCDAECVSQYDCTSKGYNLTCDTHSHRCVAQSATSPDAGVVFQYPPRPVVDAGSPQSNPDAGPWNYSLNLLNFNQLFYADGDAGAPTYAPVFLRLINRAPDGGVVGRSNNILAFGQTTVRLPSVLRPNIDYQAEFFIDYVYNGTRLPDGGFAANYPPPARDVDGNLIVDKLGLTSPDPSWYVQFTTRTQPGDRVTDVDATQLPRNDIVPADHSYRTPF